MMFKDIIGQEQVIRKLIQTVTTGRLSHAQLLVGTPGRGTLPLAMAYAQYINCDHRTETDSCGECSSCLKMNQLVHPDVHFVYPVNKSKLSASTGNSDTDRPVSDHFAALWRTQVFSTGGYFDEADWYKTIEIENKQGSISKQEANEIIKKLSFKSFESDYKIMIIWLPERMNDMTANTLLKIIEEPWDKTLFLMVAESVDKILATILSRTQEVTVAGIQRECIAQALINEVNVPLESAEMAARLSMGDYLRAKRLLTEVDQDDTNLELLRRLLSFSAVKRHLELFELAENLAELGRENQKRFIDNGIRVLRECYMINMNLPEVSYSMGNEHELCKKIAPFVHSQNIESLIQEFELAKQHVIQNGNPKIVFTHFALALSKLVYKQL